MRKCLLYIAGPYRGDIDGNIARARKAAIELIELGHDIICPHLNTAHFEKDCNVPENRYIEMDLNILARCDGIVLLPNWRQSEGANAEYALALKMGIPQWEYPLLPTLPLDTHS